MIIYGKRIHLLSMFYMNFSCFYNWMIIFNRPIASQSCSLHIMNMYNGGSLDSMSTVGAFSLIVKLSLKRNTII